MIFMPEVVKKRTDLSGMGSHEAFSTRLSTSIWYETKRLARVKVLPSCATKTSAPQSLLWITSMESEYELKMTPFFLYDYD